MNVRDMTARAYKYKCPTPSGPYINVEKAIFWTTFTNGFNVAGRPFPREIQEGNTPNISGPLEKIGGAWEKYDNHDVVLNVMIGRVMIRGWGTVRDNKEK